MRRSAAVSRSALVSVAGVALLAGLLLREAGARAADKRDAEGTVIKTEDGIRFKLPADWPIEKRNGILGPVPVEEYLSKKFSAIENRLQQAEQQLNSLDLRLRVMEEEIKKQQRLKSSEQPR